MKCNTPWKKYVYLSNIKTLKISLSVISTPSDNDNESKHGDDNDQNDYDYVDVLYDDHADDDDKRKQKIMWYIF